MSAFCIIYLADGEDHVVGGVYFTTAEKANQAKGAVAEWAFLHPSDCQVEDIAQWALPNHLTFNQKVQDLTFADDMTIETLRKHVYGDHKGKH